MILKLILLSLVTYATAVIKTELGFKWTQFDNVIMSTSVLYEVSNLRGRIWCVARCLQDHACISVFYRRQYRRCQFHDVLFMSPKDGEQETGTRYYSVTTNACPSHYVHNRLLNICYQLHLNKINRNEGLADCTTRGEHLVVIDSEDKQVHLLKQISSSSENLEHNYFIDGSDAATEGQWILHDGRPMTYFAWRPGFPANVSTAHDYIIESKLIQRTSIYVWQDRASKDTKYYICQKDL
ncbi:perlucin-like [Haliotis asinina]|uniref:perlucin-like n=1 Tax=Haliotis asinina TaxID=109174 RepID=UPI003531E0AD